MTRSVVFRSKREIAAERNLAQFIQRQRANVSHDSSRGDFHWNDPAWPAVRWVNLGVGTRRRFGDDELLHPEFRDFAKAYHVWKSTARPSVALYEFPALRCIESVLLAQTGSGSIQGLSIAVLDEAANEARVRFAPSARYHVGREIRRLAEFVSTQRLIPRDLSMWKSPLGRPSSTRRTGTEGDAEIQRKLPSEAGLHAMAEIFANDPQDPPTRFVSAVWGLLMSAPWRISEVLALHVDAECEETDDKGIVSYGVRYYGVKGFAHDVKWVPTAMESVAREAFRRLLELSESARVLARHLELSPDTPFLYADAPEVGVDDPLTLDQKAAYLRKPLPKGGPPTSPEWSFQSIRERWDKARARVPRGFPLFPSRTGLKWSEALCCVHRNLLHATRPVDWYGLVAPTANTVNDLLGSGRWKTGVPTRLGYREPDGGRIRLHSHQPRHYLSTLAERGSMAQADLAKWAGRALVRDNRVYNHVPQSERAARIGKALVGTALAGPSSALPVPTPTTPAQFNWTASGPTHRTEFGVCEHDWAMTPCTKNLDCLTCSEHVCRKGDLQARIHIKARYEHHVAECTKALDAVAAGTAVVDRWLEHALKSLIREQQLLALMESESIEDGAPIRLADASAEHSHLRRALDQRIPQLRDPSLPQSIQKLIARYVSGESPLDGAD